MASHLLSQLPCEEAATIFQEITRTLITDYTMHEICDRVGEAAKLQTVLLSRQKVEATIEELSGHKTWRPVLVVAAAP